MFKSTYQRQPAQHTQTAPTDTTASRQHTSLPNSLFLSQDTAMDTQLEQTMRARVAALRRQIPAAEREADRLSQGITATTVQGVMREMGERLDADFSNVQIYTDPSAANKADRMGAKAYTEANHVYFGSDGFDPVVAAHELVHTVQQGAVDGVGVQQSVGLGTVQMKPPGWWKDAKKLAQKYARDAGNIWWQLSSKTQEQMIYAAYHELMAYEANRGPKTKRDLYMGDTPNKQSSVGKEVFDRMYANQEVMQYDLDQVTCTDSVTKDGNDLRYFVHTYGKPNDGYQTEYYHLDSPEDARYIHMGHIYDAVEFWNKAGKYTRAKSQFVRDFMRDPWNYQLQWGRQNCSIAPHYTYEPPESNPVTVCYKSPGTIQNRTFYENLGAHVRTQYANKQQRLQAISARQTNAFLPANYAARPIVQPAFDLFSAWLLDPNQAGFQNPFEF